MRKPKSVRERAARALCMSQGHEPNITMDGAPMWHSFLEEVDVVLKAVLKPECWEALKDAPDELDAEHLQKPLNIL
ncbi:hypothetical protein N1037_14770 [Phaeobacter sp. G2]|nr:hypothetical protein N1037_14770 [Phaeobacter sp. G2]